LARDAVFLGKILGIGLTAALDLIIGLILIAVLTAGFGETIFSSSLAFLSAAS
jgi:hypothetical protein